MAEKVTELSAREAVVDDWQQRVESGSWPMGRHPAKVVDRDTDVVSSYLPFAA